MGIAKKLDTPAVLTENTSFEITIKHRNQKPNSLFSLRTPLLTLPPSTASRIVNVFCSQQPTKPELF